jgi:SAM-dependent methyltransferase
MSAIQQDEVTRVYANRFDRMSEYRLRVWRVLVASFFQAMVPETGTVLDLGCGYGEFINTVKAGRKLGMDLNPQSKERLASGIEFFQQDCSLRWPLDTSTLDVVFTSNFFEHLPDKVTLGRTLDEVFRCLKPGGGLIAMGPNIKFTEGRYWDFWDHYLPLTETSLAEGLRVRGFQIDRCWDRFLPYTMVGGPAYPLWMLSVYLKFPILWRWKGEQFLVVARKPTEPSQETKIG